MQQKTTEFIVGFLLVVVGYIAASVSAFLVFTGFAAGGLGGHFHNLQGAVFLFPAPVCTVYIGYYVISREYHVLLRLLSVPFLLVGALGVLVAFGIFFLMA